MYLEVLLDALFVMTDSSPPLFSRPLMALYRKVRAAKDQDERTTAMMALARRFAAEHDALDYELSEDFHEFVEAYERSRLAHQQTALRLARLAVNVMEECLKEAAVPLDDPDPDQKAN